MHDLRAMLNPSRIALVSMAERIGIQSFVVFLEYRYFKPGTEMNKHFHFAIVDWMQMKWFVVIVHKRHLETVDKLAKLLGLRRGNGIPHMITFERGQPIKARFPLDTDNVWTMENIEGHFCYNNNRDLERKAREFEHRACDAEIEEHYAKWLAKQASQ